MMIFDALLMIYDYGGYRYMYIDMLSFWYLICY
jgi:hypothetical protein